jgi:hypothetical protein
VDGGKAFEVVHESPWVKSAAVLIVDISKISGFLPWSKFLEICLGLFDGLVGYVVPRARARTRPHTPAGVRA